MWERLRRRVLIAALAALVVTCACFAYITVRDRRAAQTAVISPFLNLIDDRPGRELTDGLRYAFAEQSAARLNALPGRPLIARTDPRQVSRCGFAVFGSFRLIDSVRLSAQAVLVNARGEVIWDSPPRTMTRYHADELVDELATEIARVVADHVRRPREGRQDHAALGMLCRGAALAQGGEHEAEQALGVLAEAAERLHHPGEARVRLGLAFWRLGQLERALDAWRARLDDDGDLDADAASVMLAAAVEASGVSWQSEKTLAVARAAAGPLESDPNAHESLARLALVAGEPQEARDAAEAACRLSLPKERRPEPRIGARRCLLLADAWHALADRSGEVAAVAAAALLFPTSPVVRRRADGIGLSVLATPQLLAIAEAGPSEAVRRIAARCRGRLRWNPPPWNYRDRLRALQEDPFSRAALAAVVRHYVARRRFDEADALWRRLTARSPAVVAYRQGLTETCLARWDWHRNDESARQALDAVRTLAACADAPECVRLETIWALVQRGLHLDEARRMLDGLPFDASDPRFLRVRGWMRVQSEQWDDGEADLRAIRNIVPRGSPDYFDACTRLADSAMRQGRKDDALERAEGSGCILCDPDRDTEGPRGELRIVAMGRTVAAFHRSSGRRAWFVPVGSKVSALTLDDVDGDGVNEALVGTDREGSDHAVVYLIGADGKQRWAYPVGAFGPYDEDDALGCQVIRTADLTGDRRKEIVVLAGHAPGCTGRMVALKDAGDHAELIGEYWNYGIFQSVAAGMTKAGPRIVFSAVDNTVQDAYRLRIGVVNPAKLAAPPAWGPDDTRCFDPEWTDQVTTLTDGPLSACDITTDRDIILPHGREPWRYDARTMRRLARAPVPKFPGEVVRGSAPFRRRRCVHDADSPAEFHALLVGVDRTACAELRSLPSAAADVNAMQSTLLRVCRYRSASVKALAGPAATSEAVRGRLADLGDTVPAGDTVLIYWSGHGFCAGNDGYLATSDTRSQAPGGGAMRVSDLIRALERSLYGCHVALVLDTCYPLDDHGPLMLLLDRAARGATRLASMAVWCSCSPGEKAYGPESGKPGLFAAAFEAEAAAPGGLRRSPKEFELDVMDRVVRRAKGQGRSQTPKVLGDLPPLWRVPGAARSAR